MKCPKCNEGDIGKGKLKGEKELVQFCDFCETIWFIKDEIKSNTGHPYEVLHKDTSIEYTIDTVQNEEESIFYTHIK